MPSGGHLEEVEFVEVPRRIGVNGLRALVLHKIVGKSLTEVGAQLSLEQGNDHGLSNANLHKAITIAQVDIDYYFK